MAEIATKGTLCLSFAHVVELLAWNPREGAIARAKWLDSLPCMWVDSEHALDEELKADVWHQLGLIGREPRMPIHRAMTAAIDSAAISVEWSVQILAAPTIAGCVRIAHGNMDHNLTRSEGVRIFRELHVDRATLPADVTNDDLARVALSKFVDSLRRRARRAIDWDPTLVELDRIPDATICAAIDVLIANPRSLPINRLGQHVMANVGRVIAEQSSDSKRFTERYASFPFDLRHLIGGGFADILTCDKFVDNAIGEFRTQRNRLPQLSVGGCGGLTGFVRALKQQADRF